jgi:hypothetical protein
VAFAGTAFGAAAFLGFFFSLLCELLPLPIVVTSILAFELGSQPDSTV